MNDPDSTITATLWGQPFAFHGGVWSAAGADPAGMVQTLNDATPQAMRHSTARELALETVKSLGFAPDVITSVDEIPEEAELEGVA